MTEKEAIKWQEAFRKTYNEFPKEASEACDMAISALEEIQQHRALGTVEELQEAREKQMSKTPYIWGDGYSDGYPVYDMYDCPNCGRSYEIDGEKYDFCPNCGQAIDWSVMQIDANEDNQEMQLRNIGRD